MHTLKKVIQMNIKKGGIIILMLLFPLIISAQSMKEIWASMPDTMALFVKASQRVELVDLYEKGLDPVVNNGLNGKTRLDTLTSNYLFAHITEKSTLQIKKLKYQDGDSIICVVRTYDMKAPESCVSLFTTSWKYLKNLHWMITDFAKSPSDDSQLTYQQLLDILDPAFVKATLNAHNDQLMLSVSSPLISQEDFVKISPFLLQRKLNWNGKIFN